MKPLSLLLIIGEGILAAALTFVGFQGYMRMGGTPLLVTPALAVLMGVLAGVLLWLGLQVRRFRANKKSVVDAIGAMWVAVFARTSALVGSVLTGILVGVALVSLTQLSAPMMGANALTAGIVGVVALVWVVIAMVVERWCVITPDDEASTPPRGRAAA